MAFVYLFSPTILSPKSSQAIATRDVPIRRATPGIATRTVVAPGRPAVTTRAHLARRDVIFGTASSSALILSPLASRVAAADEGGPLVGRVVHKLYAAFVVGDIPGVLKLFSPDVVLEPATMKGSPYKALYKGVAGAQEMIAALSDKEEVSQFDVTNVVAQGNTAVALVNLTATVKSTGKQYSVVVTHKWTLDDQGLLVGLQEYTSDTAACTAAYEA